MEHSSQLTGKDAGKRRLQGLAHGTKANGALVLEDNSNFKFSRGPYSLLHLYFLKEALKFGGERTGKSAMGTLGRTKGRSTSPGNLPGFSEKGDLQ